MSSIGRLNEDMAIVNTLMVSAFFAVGDGASLVTVTLSGVAVIGFKTTETRKLITVGMKEGDNIRKLQYGNEAAASGEGTFNVEVVLSDGEQVDGSQSFNAFEYLTPSLVMLAMIPIVLFLCMFISSVSTFYHVDFFIKLKLHHYIQ